MKGELSIIGLDLKKNLEESFSDKGTLDDIIDALEQGKVQEVPTQKIGIRYKNAVEEVTRFLSWVVSTGTKYNHQYGLLNLK